MEHLKKLLSFGNNKLPKSTAIFNMGSACTCASDLLGLCEVSNICYAKKAEKMYKAVLPYRHRQQQYWLNCSAETFADQFIETIQAKRNKVKYLRFNESGDFFTQDCVDKLEQIATILRCLPVFVYTYTARTDLNYHNCKNLVVNGSNFMVHNLFKPVAKFTGLSRQCLGNCKLCELCTKNRNYIIEVKKH